MERNKLKFDKDLAQKVQELNEMKLHLDQFQKYYNFAKYIDFSNFYRFIISSKPEAKGLLEY